MTIEGLPKKLRPSGKRPDDLSEFKGQRLGVDVSKYLHMMSPLPLPILVPTPSRTFQLMNGLVPTPTLECAFCTCAMHDGRKEKDNTVRVRVSVRV